MKAKKRKFNKKDLAQYKKLILKLKDEFADALDHSSEDALKKSPREAAGDISGYAFHMADLATDTYNREFSLDIAASERKVLYEIDGALKRIEDGTYGICEGCQGPITKVRLKAIPFTRLCLKCQEAKENGS